MSSSESSLVEALSGRAGLVLEAGREARARELLAAADQLRLAAEWADLHPAASVGSAGSRARGLYGDVAVEVAGEGAPLVAEFCLAELAAVLGLSSWAGRTLVGDALELRHRLPRLWESVMSGVLAAWRARQVAQKTRHLSVEAAGFIDAHLAPFAHKISGSVVDRLVVEAISRFSPEAAEAAREEAAERRHLVIELHPERQVGPLTGTALVTGEIDLPDALDLEAALIARAAELADLGCRDSLNVRRARALGDLARADRTLDLAGEPTADPQADPGAADADAGAEVAGEDPSVQAPAHRAGRLCGRRGRQQAVLYLHLSQAALTGAPGGGLGRVENTRTIVTADTIREWLRRRDLELVVKPVLDLAERIAVEAYEIPDRLAEQTSARDLTCVFPHCHRPARGCDHDHVVPHPDGATCTENIAILCRRHHRLKTFGGWHYDVLQPGRYLWTSPHRHRFLRDHTGTLALPPDDEPGEDPDEHPEPDPPPDD